MLCRGPHGRALELSDRLIIVCPSGRDNSVGVLQRSDTKFTYGLCLWNWIKLASSILKEIYFAFIIIDIFQIFNVDLICIVLHLGVKCTMISDNIFATYKNNPSSSVMFHLHFTQKITFHQKKMVKPYQMFHRFKADINKFQMGKFTSHIVLVGLGEFSCLSRPLPKQTEVPFWSVWKSAISRGSYSSQAIIIWNTDCLWKI